MKAKVSREGGRNRLVFRIRYREVKEEQTASTLGYFGSLQGSGCKGTEDSELKTV